MIQSKLILTGYEAGEMGRRSARQMEMLYLRQVADECDEFEADEQPMPMNYTTRTLKWSN